MSKIILFFPHQLFEDLSSMPTDATIVLVEEYLFFKQYRFHQQKIAFHRASMKKFAQHIQESGRNLIYIESISEYGDIRLLLPFLKKQQEFDEIHVFDLVDQWLEQRLKKACDSINCSLFTYDSPQFLNKSSEIVTYFKDKKRFFQTDFYIDQRKKRGVLVDDFHKPLGGKWSFDAENRKKYPAKKTPPHTQFEIFDSFYEEAFQYVETHFSDHVGELNRTCLFPTDFGQSKAWLDRFLENRLWEFGIYEDAIVERESVLHHSVLTPMLNVGLLTPEYILKRTLDFAEKESIPLNSLEGFVRQIMGWREFIRAMYQLKGVDQRTRNFWQFKRKIPASFWDGTTGITPVDATIRKLNKTAYCHHIERLMVLGNFMLLCEFDPDEVYKWFMVFFIDSYDWVMVPNVYGMSQFADGGIFATKPYISGSNYLFKMSDYSKGSWSEIWDALFWNFMDKHRDFFLQNPRLGMLIKQYDKQPIEKREKHVRIADDFLQKWM